MQQFIREVALWRDERHQLIQLHYEKQDLYAVHGDRINKAKLAKASRDEVQYLEYEQWDAVRYVDERISSILTDRLIRQSVKHGVPIPDRDIKEYWQYAENEDRRVLTTEGAAFLRHQIAKEREIMRSPIIHWGGMAISVLSLVVATIALIRSG